MPSPSSSLATLRPDLSQSLEQFDLAADRAGFIGPIVCPVINVAKASGNTGIIPVEQLLQSPDTARSPGSGYQRGKFTFKPDTFVTTEHGWEELVDDNESAMYSSYFSAEMISAARALDFVLRSYESRVAAAYFNTANFTNTGVAGAVKWSTIATATPLTDIEAAVLLVYAQCGLWPNCLILTRKAFRYLRRCAQITDLVKYNGLMDVRAGKVTAQAIAEVCDLERVIIAGSTTNTAKEGQAAAFAQLWDPTMAMVAHIDFTGGEDFRRPTVGRTFHWAEDGSTIGGTMESYRDETRRSDVIRCRNQTQEKLLYSGATGAATLITGVL